MSDYSKFNFKNYIPDKDIYEKVLTENPVSLNLQEVPVLNDFVKTLLVSQKVTGYGSIIKTLEGTGICSKRVF